MLQLELAYCACVFLGCLLCVTWIAYRIEHHEWRRLAEISARQAYAATQAIQHARHVRKLQVRHYMDEANAFYAEKQAAEGRVDGLEAAMIEIRRIAAKKIKKIDGLQAFPAEAVHHLASCNCSCQGNAIQANANYHNSECMVGRAQQFLAAGGDDGDWGRPVTVGDPDVDPLYAEISFCGPRHIAVYLRRRGPCPATGDVTRNGTCGIVLGGTGPQSLLATFGERESCLDSVGLAHVENVDQITEIIRAYNQSFHQAKGVADAGAIQEEKRGDRGRPGCDDHGA